MGLGQRIRELRQSRGLTQGQLGGQDLTKSFISLVERERTNPSVETLQTIARRLGTSIDGLLGQEGRLHEQAATSLLALSAEAVRDRSAVRAAPLLDAAEFVATAYGIEEAQREVLLQRAQLAIDERAYDRATPLLADAKQRADRATDRWRSGRALVLLGVAHLRRRNIPQAVETLQAALKVLRQGRASRDPARVEALLALGTAIFYTGDLDHAIAWYQQAATSQVAKQDPVHRGRALWGLGAAYRKQGKLEQAAAHLLKAKDAFEAAEELRDMIRVLHNLGELSYEVRNYREALRHFHQALRAAERVKMDVERAAILTEIARTHLALGDAQEAEPFAERALRCAQQVGDPIEVAEAQVVLGKAAAAQGKHQDAVSLLKAALKTFQARQVHLRTADIARELGIMLLAKGAKADAANHLALALEADDARRRAEPASVEAVRAGEAFPGRS